MEQPITHETLRVSAPSDGVRLLVIDRPRRRNALDRATYAALGTALRRADADEAVRAVVLAGAGGCFTAGNDIADFRVAADDPAAGAGEESPGLAFLKVLAACTKPVLAAVEGHAVGIGTTLLLHCDLAYAGAGARLRLPFVALGLSPEGASSYLLPLVAGSKRAAELLMLGEPFGAEAAREAGIVNAVVPEGEDLAAALAQAEKLAALPPVSVAATKRALRAGHAEAVARTLASEAETFHRLRRGPAAQAAFTAFLAR